MTANQQLHDLGQSLWIDNITREMLDTGALARYIDELCVTGLTSNPSIFDKAVAAGSDYDADIRALYAQGDRGEQLFFDIAIADLRRAAELFAPVHERTSGVDGYVSLEVSPTVADDTPKTIAMAADLSARASRPNVYIKIPGTEAGLPAITESIAAGIPINVTLLFSREQYLGAAEAYMAGLERRLEAGQPLDIASVASVFVSRWDVAVGADAGEELRNHLGIEMGKRTYKAYRDLLASDRWQRLESNGARPQRLLWASTGTKDPNAPDTLYIHDLAAPDTVNTMPEPTLLALAEHGAPVTETLPADGGDAEEQLARFEAAGIDLDALAERLQVEGVAAFDKAWSDLLDSVETKSSALAQA